MMQVQPKEFSEEIIKKIQELHSLLDNNQINHNISVYRMGSEIKYECIYPSARMAYGLGNIADALAKKANEPNNEQLI